MKKNVWGIILCVVLWAVGLPVMAGEKAPPSMENLANTQLTNYGTDPIIIEAVRAQNAQGKPLKQIRKLDEKWKRTPGVADFMKTLITSKCGKHLGKIQRNAGYFAEIFVMDNQGANVAMTFKTSDYWQGDEDKFIRSYNDGMGGIHISDVEFDDSAQAYLVQVSIPVKDGEKVIGAITFGIDLDAFEKKK
ncbi:PDC sensor domain-containing protein [Desulfococcaceae bacterium HSG8]|nr:PDC sensor domain-containing protein [Desulfococcaceae bacterium HSG8]